MCYIYTLHASNDPECRPRYVGFTRDPKRRASQHNGAQNNGRKKAWAKGVLSSGGKVVLRIIFSFRSDNLSEQGIIEAGFIEKYRFLYPDLLNDMGAGNGIARCSEKQKETVRQALLGMKRPPGRKLSQAHKEAISRGNKGKKKKPEHAAKCRIARLGIPHSDEVKKKIGDWSRGKKKSAVTIERMKQAWISRQRKV